MNETSPRAGKVFRLVLAPGLPVERAILNRCVELSRHERERWLRGLLVNSFLLECRALHTTQASTADCARVALQNPTPYVLPARFTGNSAQQREAPPTAAQPITEPNDKPLAALRRVIG